MCRSKSPSPGKGQRDGKDGQETREQGWRVGLRAADISLLLAGAHTHTHKDIHIHRHTHRHTDSQMVRAAVPAPKKYERDVLVVGRRGCPPPPQAGAQWDERISLPTRLCSAPLPHLKGAAKAGEGKQEVPPPDPT